jgi:hypothetical protein
VGFGLGSESERDRSDSLIEVEARYRSALENSVVG